MTNGCPSTDQRIFWSVRQRCTSQSGNGPTSARPVVECSTAEAGQACAQRSAEADMPVVTIARLLGSRGDEIGRALADRLNYRYLDHRLLLDYVREFGEVEANAPEIAETRPSFWERLNEERRRHAIVVRCGVYGFAKDDDAVIVGLGGNYLMRGMSHALRTITLAPTGVRVNRVIERHSGNLDHNTAAEVVRRSDRERGGFIRYMYNADWMDVHSYDMVLNTANLEVDQAVDLLAYSLDRA